MSPHTPCPRPAPRAKHTFVAESPVASHRIDPLPDSPGDSKRLDRRSVRSTTVRGAMSWLVLAGEPSGDRIAAAAVRALSTEPDRSTRPWGIGGDASARGRRRARRRRVGALGDGRRRRGRARPGARPRARRRRPPRPPRSAAGRAPRELHRALGEAWGRSFAAAAAASSGASRRKSGPGGRGASAPSRPRSIASRCSCRSRRSCGDGPASTRRSSDTLRSISRASVPATMQRDALGIDRSARAVAVLPGSRAGEIARLAEPLARAAAHPPRSRRRRSRHDDRRAGDRRARAPRSRTSRRRHDLEPPTPTRSRRRAAPRSVRRDPRRVGHRFARGRARRRRRPSSVIGSIASRTRSRSASSPRARRLPNVLLGRRVFPELLQDDLSPERAADAAELLARRRARARALASELADI